MRCHPRFVAVASALFTLLLASPSAAITTVYGVVAGGVDEGHACLTSAGAGLCSGEATFSVDATFPVTGTITHDSDAGTADIELVALSVSMPGSHDGVTEVLFTSVTYKVVGMPIPVAGGGQLLGTAATGTVEGTYEQKDGALTVEGPTAFGPLPVDFTGISCLGLLGVGNCGFIVGGSRDFELRVGVTGGGDPTDFVHFFNFNAIVIPEPATASLLTLGLLALGFAGRRR